MKRKWHGLLVGLLVCLFFVYPQITLAAEEATAKIPVHIEENEKGIEGAIAQIIPDEATYPMPESNTVTTDANGDAVFTISYTSLSDYRYTIRQVISDPADEAVTYDETVFVVHVSTVYDEDDNIVAQVSINREESEDKTGAVSFANTRKENETEPETIEIPVKKIWKDEDDKDGIRPDAVTILLLANDEETKSTLILKKDNDWSGTFSNLPKKAGEQEINYTIKEVPVDGYTTAITGSVTEGYTVTNTHTPEEKPTPTPTKEVTPTPTTTVTPAPTNPPTTTSTPVKTGDASSIGLWLLVLLSASATLTGMAILRRKRSN